MCMAHINYPAKVLFKSANPVVTMIFGLIWFKKKYALRDYIVVFLLVLGLYLFMAGGAKSESAPKGTGYGIFLVTLSMFGSAGK
jgi:drug/metabolite transporter (DMT)-like permease